jgi:hypothetical protein
MPQANITYDTPYNRALASKVISKEARMALREASTNLHPFRLGSFHNPHDRTLTGGGAPQEFITNGNSPAYPPISMRSGLAVQSGGAYIGVDGAVGGGFWKDFARGFTGVLDVATLPLSLIAPPAGVGIGALSQGVKSLSGSGQHGGAMSGGVTSGAGFWSDFGKGFKKGFFGTIKALTKPIEILAPKLKPVVDVTNALGELAGEGEGGAFGDSLRGAVGSAAKLARKVAPVAEAIFGKKSPFLNKAVALAQQVSSMMPADMRGGVGMKDIASVAKTAEGMAKHLAPVLPFVMKYMRGSGMCSDCMYNDGMMRLGKSMRGGVLSGGFGLSDVMGLVKKGKALYDKGKPLVEKAIGVAKKGKKVSVADVMDLVESVKPALSGRGMVGNKKDACGRSSGTRDYMKPCADTEGAGFFDFLPYSKASIKKREAELLRRAIARGGAASGGVMSGGKKNGRAARAAIVKKIMKERGVKMIEASKIVKAEGLY